MEQNLLDNSFLWRDIQRVCQTDDVKLAPLPAGRDGGLKNARADISTRTIFVMPILEPYALCKYFIALHEFSHIALGHQPRLLFDGDRLTLLTRETEAWKRAFEIAITKPDAEVELMVAEALGTYFFHPLIGKLSPPPTHECWRIVSGVRPIRQSELSSPFWDV